MVASTVFLLLNSVFINTVYLNQFLFTRSVQVRLYRNFKWKIASILKCNYFEVLHYWMGKNEKQFQIRSKL